MNIYEFITPSDPITFKANDDKVAYTCALLLGEGKAGCRKHIDGEEVSIPTMVAFLPDPSKQIEEFLGQDVNVFVENHKNELRDCFSSFSYGSVNDRQSYDDAVNAITDSDKLIEFKKKHEVSNRTSLSAWVKAAWSYADNFKS